MAPVHERLKSGSGNSGRVSVWSGAALHIFGIVALLVALIISLLLSAKHIWSLSVAGCGAGGGCEWTLNGPYSRFLGIAVAYWGAGFFAALLLLWSTATVQERPTRICWLARAGAVVSLTFVGIMVFTAHLCPWCLAVHGANLLFWILVELSSRLSSGAEQPNFWKHMAALIVAGLLVTVLQGLDWREQLSVQATQHEAALKSLAAMQVGAPDSMPIEQFPSAPEPIKPSPTDRPDRVLKKAEGNRFGGRYWLGSSTPKVRIVLFHDYQCELCFQVEDIIKGLLAERSDLAVSVKQWPFDSSCNRFILGSNPHPGACLASRAAEAAGLLGGDSIFWKLHYWLVERGGRIDDQSIDQQVRGMGLEVEKFREILNGARVDSIIEADISEGMTYGLKWTPMVFVNGYQVQGWNTPGALPAAIDRAAALAAANPRKLDQPETAINLQLRAWQQEPIREIPITDADHIRGDRQAGTTLIAFGDLTCSYNAAFFGILEEALEKNRSVRVVFKDFPLDGQCNDLVKREINPFGCFAARLAQAAGTLGGDVVYFKAAQWLLGHRTSITLYSAAELASILGLAESALGDALAAPGVEQQVVSDVTLAKQLGVDTSPTVFVNGRRVSGWQTPGLLDQVLQVAQRPARR
jgi:protein-disulfide isomerase